MSNAPLHYIHAISIHSNASSVSGVTDSNFVLSGGATGVFSAPGDLFGSYIYTPYNDAFARLRLEYQGQFAGDYDEMSLDFVSRTFTGTQVYNRIPGPVAGTFNKFYGDYSPDPPILILLSR